MRLDGPGSFSGYHVEPSQGLSLEVDGLGRLDFPLTEESAHQLIRRATASPFGYREQTLYDPSVRDSWEIAGKQVSLDPKLWSRRFARGVQHVAEALGLPADATVTPTLQKLLIYSENQFFSPHRDSEKAPNMWGTIVVLLPSSYEGGEVVVEHAGSRVTYDTAVDASRGKVGFLGFFADCVHEIKPVRRGHRIALTYALTVETSEPAPSPENTYFDLRQSVEDYFKSLPEDERWLIYLLDHEYSPQSLQWRSLKNSDRARVDAIRAVAEELGCACFLATADVYEEKPFDRPGEVIELRLERWIDPEGQPCQGTEDDAYSEMLVTTTDLQLRKTYKQTRVPWTGNEGGYDEQWYHEAALVVVPRDGERYEEIIRRKPQARQASAVIRRRKK